jgi:O-antigen/teichoic acid export membrane protein
MHGGSPAVNFRWGAVPAADYVRRFVSGRIGRQASLVVVGDGITFAVATVATMILARLMPEDSMGTYRQVVYLTQMAIMVADVGLSVSVYRFWNALDPERRPVYVRMIVLASLAIAIPPMVLLALLSPLLAEAYRNHGLYLALLISAPFPLATIPLSLIRPALISQGYSIRATLIETGFAFLGILSLVVPIAAGFSLNSALAVWIGVSLLRLVAVPVIFREFLIPGARWWDREILRMVWGYLWPIQLARLPSYFSGYLDKIIMSVYLLPRAFAVYSLGAREIPFVGAIAYSVSGVLLPHLVEDVRTGNVDQVCRRWRTSCLKTAFVTYFFAGFCIWNAPEVMRFLLSSTYEESSVPFRFFAAITYLRVVEYGSIPKAFGRTKSIFMMTLVAAVVLCVVAVVLTPRLGIAGMALSVVISEAAANTYMLFENRRILARPLREFFPLGHLMILASLSIVSCFAGYWAFSRVISIAASDGFVLLGCKLALLAAVSAGVYFLVLKTTGLSRQYVQD